MPSQSSVPTNGMPPTYSQRLKTFENSYPHSIETASRLALAGFVSCGGTSVSCTGCELSDRDWRDWLGHRSVQDQHKGHCQFARLISCKADIQDMKEQHERAIERYARQIKTFQKAFDHWKNEATSIELRYKAALAERKVIIATHAAEVRELEAEIKALTETTVLLPAILAEKQLLMTAHVVEVRELKAQIKALTEKATGTSNANVDTDTTESNQAIDLGDMRTGLEIATPKFAQSVAKETVKDVNSEGDRDPKEGIASVTDPNPLSMAVKDQKSIEAVQTTEFQELKTEIKGLKNTVATLPPAIEMLTTTIGQLTSKTMTAANASPSEAGRHDRVVIPLSHSELLSGTSRVFDGNVAEETTHQACENDPTTDFAGEEVAEEQAAGEHVETFDWWEDTPSSNADEEEAFAWDSNHNAGSTDTVRGDDALLSDDGESKSDKSWDTFTFTRASSDGPGAVDGQANEVSVENSYIW